MHKVAPLGALGITYLLYLLPIMLSVTGGAVVAQTVAEPIPPWRSVGPTGAQVTVIEPDPGTDTRIHVGTVGGNVFLTEDGGETWAMLGNGLLATTVTQIELPTSLDGTLFARGANGIYQWFEADLWALRPIPGNPYLYSFDVGRSADNRGVLYALTANTSLFGCCSLWTSEDQGVTWNENPTGIFGQAFLVLDTEPATLLQGGSRIYRSTDDGTTWFEATGPANQLPNVRQFFVDPIDPSKVFALAQPLDLDESKFTGRWLLASHDAGATWFVAGNGLTESSFPPATADLAINPFSPNEMIFTSELEGAFRSTDGGLNFSAFAAPTEQLPEFDPGLFAFTALGSLLGASDFQSERPLAYAPQASGPWSRPTSAFPSSAIAQVLPHADRSGDWIVRLRDGRLLRTTDGGTTWTPSMNGLEDRWLWFVLRSPTDADTLFVATTSTTDFSLDTLIHRSTDGGATWSQWSALPLDPVREMIADPRRPGRLLALGFYDAAYLSEDGGLTWSLFFEAPRTEPCQLVRDLAPSPHGDVLLAGCVRDSGAPVSPPIYHSDVFVSTDDGVTWQAATDLAAGRPTQDAWSFSFDPDAPNLAWAGLASGEFFRSTDGGLSWTPEPVGLDSLNIRDVASRAGEVLLATVSRGVLRRVEPGVWQPINQGLTSPHIRDLEYPPPNFGQVLAGTNGGGLHVLDRAQPCASDPASSCMLGRFRVTAEWRDANGAWHPAGAQQVAPGTGAFWFFDDQNLELAVKMIDGRTVNGHFWFYAGALSDVAYRIRVEDTATLGTPARTYSSEQGVISSLADVLAFAGSQGTSSLQAFTADATTEAAVATRSGSPASSAPELAAQLPLTPVPPSVQLGDYRLTVEWRLARGPGGLGFGRSLNDISGAFWFFEPNSLDLFFKILDGTAINGHDWLFVGSLTDVGFTLHVTHEPSGMSRSYDNPVGSFAGFLDLQLGPRR